MKILVVGDVHATTYWKEAFKKVNEYDHIVQLGDWFDSFHNDWKKLHQIDNFKEAIDFKKKYPEKIHILLGNHDLNNYVMGDICSGHQKLFEENIKYEIEEKMEYVDVAIELDGYVFSHAGFTKCWMEHNNLKTIDEVNNLLHKGKYDIFHFNGIDPYGDDMSQSPLWVRPSSLLYDMYFDKQIVGHTEIGDEPVGYKSGNKELIIVDSRKHDTVYEIGQEYCKYFKWALFKRFDKVKFLGDDKKIYEGVIEVVDFDGGGLCLEETSYDIQTEDMFYKHVPQSRVII